MTTGNDAAGELAAAVLALLAGAPDGLSDAELCTTLAPAHPGAAAAEGHQICRRLAGQGSLERVGARPIRNRPVDDAAAPPAVPATGPDARPDPVPGPVSGTAPEPAPGPAPEVPAPSLAPRLYRTRAGGPFARRHPGRTRPAAPDPAPRAEPAGPVVPRRDPALGWTRTPNVTAAVVAWLQRRGATLRRVDVDGPAHDLVVALDGADVHVEVTGWPPEGSRTHPATTAGEWFDAAAGAATARRRAHPRARIVVAVPETRRYRTLSEQRAATLTAARAEVWFVAPDGSMRLD